MGNAFLSKSKGIAGGTQWELVWENASPNSNFAGQTISVDLSAYSHVMVDFTAAVPSVIGKVGSTKVYATYVGVTADDTKTTIDIARRGITSNTDSIVFDDIQRSQYNTSTKVFNAMYTATTIIKPHRIYGLKGVL